MLVAYATCIMIEENVRCWPIPFRATCMDSDRSPFNQRMRKPRTLQCSMYVHKIAQDIIASYNFRWIIFSLQSLQDFDSPLINALTLELGHEFHVLHAGVCRRFPLHLSLVEQSKSKVVCRFKSCQSTSTYNGSPNTYYMWHILC